jgi:hypothetical protein
VGKVCAHAWAHLIAVHVEHRWKTSKPMLFLYRDHWKL